MKKSCHQIVGRYKNNHYLYLLYLKGLVSISGFGNTIYMMHFHVQEANIKICLTPI